MGLYMYARPTQSPLIVRPWLSRAVDGLLWQSCPVRTAKFAGLLSVTANPTVLIYHLRNETTRAGSPSLQLTLRCLILGVDMIVSTQPQLKGEAGMRLNFMQRKVVRA